MLYKCFIQYLIHTESNDMYHLHYNWPWCKYPLQSQVLSRNSNPSWASNSPDSFHPFQSTAGSSSPAQITWCNLHAPSRCRGWWMPAIHTRPFPTQKSTFITGDHHYALFYKISFRTDPVNLFGFSFNTSAEKEVYCFILQFFFFLECCYALPMFAFSFACAEKGFLKGRIKPSQVYGFRGHCVKP